MNPHVKRRMTLSPLGKLLLLPALALAVAIPSANADLLSYWNFNNDSSTYSAPNLGSLSTSASLAFGEQYDSTNKILYSNTANSTVFDSSSVYLDLSQLGGTNQNGGTTSTASWGVFSDTTTNRASTDATASGSLYANGTSFNNKYITFHLSSAGYSNLGVSYAQRTGSLTATDSWSYSLDGTNFTSIVSISNTSTGTFQAQSFSLSSLADNQTTLYLRMTYGIPSAISSTIDNFQFTGTAIPEPSTVGLLTGGAALLLVGAYRLRRKVA